MTLATDLIAVARDLVSIGTTRPKQAALRRAVSTAYYAAFHHLAGEAAKHTAGPDLNLRALVIRGLTHTTLNAVCKDIRGGSWPKEIGKRIGMNVLAAPSLPLKTVAEHFVELQQQRHVADYDPLAKFVKTDAVMLIDRAEKLVAEWSNVTDATERSFFLYSLVVLSRRAGD